MQRSAIVLALAGSTAAFSPMMSMDTGRRQVLQAGGAAAAVAPLLRANPAKAKLDKVLQVSEIRTFVTAYSILLISLEGKSSYFDVTHLHL